MWSLCAKLTDSLPTSRSGGWNDEDDYDDDALLNYLLSDDDYGDYFGGGDDDDYDDDGEDINVTDCPPPGGPQLISLHSGALPVHCLIKE